MAFHIYRTVIHNREPAANWKIFVNVLKASNGWLCLCVLCAFSLPLPAQRQVSRQPATPQSYVQGAPMLTPGSAARGKELFTGRLRLQNGGPPCAVCHSIAGLRFPNGGTLGPNLTGAYRKLGSRGMPVAMKTLYFPVMTSIYDPHPLTLEERADLLAFFKEAATEPQAWWNTQMIALAGFLGFCALLILTRVVWRDRLQSVRRRMVEQARRQGGFQS